MLNYANNMKTQYYIFGLLLIILDQIIKYITITSSPYFSFFGITWVFSKNFGVTLSWLHDTPSMFLIILQASIILIIAKIELPTRTKILFLSGGISNLIDRCLHGFVIDYMRISVGQWHWPAIINLADIYLTIGFVTWFYTCYGQTPNNTSIFSLRAVKSD